MKILNYGSLNIDHVYRVPHLSAPGETLSSTQYERCLGGKGLNQSIALRRAGCEVWHAGQIGPEGEVLRRALENEGICTLHLHTVYEPTGHAIIQVDSGGQNSIVLYGGANQCQQTSHMDAAIAALDADDILVCQNEIDQMDYLTRLAWKKRIRIALNPSPMNERMSLDILRRCTWLFVNETEAEMFCGVSNRAPEQLLDQLCTLLPDVHIILTLGSRGAMTGKNLIRHQGRACLVHAVDTTAAGDTFTGYYLAELLHTGDEQRALSVAATASGLAVSRTGASASIPRKEEVIVGSLPWRED